MATDTGKEASTDTGKEASTGTGKEASTDTGKEASTDTGKEASTDTGKEASTDTGKEASTDTRTRTGTGTAAAGGRSAGGIEVRPAAGHIGAEIDGVDLAGDLDETAVAAVRAAVLRWKVVFFRGQRLDHARHVALARRFGEPVVLARRGGASPPGFPEVETTADRLELGGRFGMDHEEWLRRRRHTLLRGWHCDHGARVDPPAATILRAETVPPYGGDTTWSNLAAAYAGLSAPVRAFVDGLRAEHRLGVGYRPRPGDDAYAQHLMDNQIATVHPLVRVHPETGERVLFVNGYYVEQIEGLSRPESAAILQMLLEQAVRPEYTVRFRWEPGSVAFWDNRATIHLAPGDHTGLGHPRIMHRVMLHGEVPLGVDGRPSEPLTGSEPGRW